MHLFNCNGFINNTQPLYLATTFHYISNFALTFFAALLRGGKGGGRISAETLVDLIVCTGDSSSTECSY